MVGCASSPFRGRGEGVFKSISWVACKPPRLEKKEGDVTLDEVDQLFRLALTASWCKCGDDHAHGQADIRVDALLENAAALARAFAETIRRSKPEALNPSSKPRQMSRAGSGESRRRARG